ncbi:hypothetical protein SKAU_G00285340 [Synaphobranchus kaupii]|uniref:Uncharacterized protein n=1 Tax=Synaphobranchus kaupii TaxID=118154 RepID=A0A9Q1EXU3_SYNKA|nr:hypothetical protein SKAU_G00285340 [Synaphobranchus kaupii]
MNIGFGPSDGRTAVSCCSKARRHFKGKRAQGWRAHVDLSWEGPAGAFDAPLCVAVHKREGVDLRKVSLRGAEGELRSRAHWSPPGSPVFPGFTALGRASVFQGVTRAPAVSAPRCECIAAPSEQRILPAVTSPRPAVAQISLRSPLCGAKLRAQRAQANNRYLNETRGVTPAGTWRRRRGGDPAHTRLLFAGGPDAASITDRRVVRPLPPAALAEHRVEQAALTRIPKSPTEGELLTSMEAARSAAQI